MASRAETTDWKAIPRPLLVAAVSLLGGLTVYASSRFVGAVDATAQGLLVEKQRNDSQDHRLTATDQALEKLTKTVDRMALDQVCASLYDARRRGYTEAIRYFGARVNELGGRCE